MTKSLHRELEAIRRALAGRPPDPPDPPGPSINEELSRWDPNRTAGFLAVIKRIPEYDRYCDDHDPGLVAVTDMHEMAWLLGGTNKELWGTCVKCKAELGPYELGSKLAEPEPEPEPELYEDDTGQFWRARHCKACERKRSKNTDWVDAAWTAPMGDVPNPWDFCTTCGRELDPSQPATRDG